MARRFSTILENCLECLDRGESLADVLVHYPEWEDKLKQLLLVAMASRAMPIPIPSQTAQRLGRNQMLAEMNHLEIKQAFRKRSSVPFISRGITSLVSMARTWGLNRLAYSYRLTAVLVVLAVSGGFFTLNASASSQPWDFLYTLKLGLERAGLVRSVPEDLPTRPPFLDEAERMSIRQEGGDNFELQQEGDGNFESFPEFDLGPLAIDPVETDQETDKDLKEAEKEEEKDLKEAEKEAEKAEREAEKKAEKILKDEEKILKKADKEEK